MKHIINIKRTICICLLIQLFISHKLWFPLHREFPLVNAIDIFPLNFGVWGDLLIYLLSIFCLIAIIIFPLNKVFIYSFVFLSGLFVLEDIIRFQPWLYIFILFLVTPIILRSKEREILFIFRIILAATYFWSGFQKLNHAFTVELFPWLTGPFGLGNFFEAHHHFGYLVGAIELLAGIGLLFRRSQIIGGVTAMLIHLFLLISIGPLGNNWNVVIWPWNAAMIMILFFVIPFRKNDQTLSDLADSFLLVKKIKWFWLVSVLVFVLPILNYCRSWDSHLSGSLYSGNNSEGVFYYEEADRKNMPAASSKFQFYNDSTGQEFLLIDQWVLDELDAPFYPEERYFRQVGKYLCKKVKDKTRSGIKITMKKKFTSEQYLKTCSCEELEKGINK